MGKCGEGAVRVVQIATCLEAGWQAVFGIDGTVETEPVACWLLVDHGGDQHVHPACAMGVEVGDATRAGNYLGIIPPGGDPKLLLEPVAAAIGQAAP
jgi:hypothetical protein